MSNAAFYDALRQSKLFGATITQGQVDGCESILRACGGFPLPHKAHVLAEVWRETGGGMMPVKETVMPWHTDKNPTDTEVQRRLESAWINGQLPWVAKPYWRDGWFGRGQLQLTHKDGYGRMSPVVGVDLVAYPARALDLDVSARIAAQGCSRGMFRGVRLSDYDGPKFDHFNARDIVNGDAHKRDKPGGPKVGDQIANAAHHFETALRAIPAADPGSSSLWTALFGIFTSIFGGRK